jgi:hypothetical protein
VQGEGILETIAELSVAFTGFTGVVAVFGRRPEAPWAPVEVFRFRVLLGASLATLFFSLLPFILHYSGLSNLVLWRACSGLVALHLASVAALDSRSLVRLRREGARPFFFALEASVAIVALPIFSAQVVNALGYLGDVSFALFLSALVYYLFVAAVNFVRLLSGVGVDIRAGQ